MKVPFETPNDPKGTFEASMGRELSATTRTLREIFRAELGITEQ
jgi:hypothetical protein